MGSVISSLNEAFFTIGAAIKTLAKLNTQFQAVLSRASSPPGLPRENSTASYWVDDPPFPSLTNIQQPLPAEADVLIVGSGITSVAVAKALLEYGNGGYGQGSVKMQPLSLVVCEAREICSGATARNGGHIKSTAYEVFGVCKRTLGSVEAAKRITRFQRRHLEVVLEVGADVPEGEAREVDTVDLFLEEDDFEKAKQDAGEMLKELEEEECKIWSGDDARKEFGVNGLVKGAISYKAGALWPYRLVTGVWNQLLSTYDNLTISTTTPVLSVVRSSDSTSHPYLVETSRGLVKVKHVIHATNGFATQLVPSLKGSITGALAHMSAQSPGTEFPVTHGNRSWSIAYSPGFDYVTQRPDHADGTPGDLMIGGGFFRSRKQALDQMGVWDDSRVDALPLIHIRGVMQAVHEPNWGPESGLIKAWTGILGFTGDLMPFVGRLPSSVSKDKGKDAGEWIAVGFNGEGMVWTWLSGTALAIMVLGLEDEVLEKGKGFPGGKLRDWFPMDELKVDAARLRRAKLTHLVDEAT